MITKRPRRSPPNRFEAVWRLGLAGWIFLLSLGGVSPTMHAWLHGDSTVDSHCELHEEHPSSQQSSDTPASPDHPEHFCGVTQLNSGALPVVALQIPDYAPLVWTQLSSTAERVVVRPIPLRRLARAPPIEIVV